MAEDNDHYKDLLEDYYTKDKEEREALGKLADQADKVPENKASIDVKPPKLIEPTTAKAEGQKLHEAGAEMEEPLSDELKEKVEKELDESDQADSSPTESNRNFRDLLEDYFTPACPPGSQFEQEQKQEQEQDFDR